MSDPLIINLPLPPSVNRYSGKLGNQSPIVQAWWDQADRHVFEHMREVRRKATKDAFVLHVTWSDKYWTKWDADNRVKPLLDYLERIEAINNDKKLWFLSVGWGEAPLGCRVQIRPKDHMDGRRNVG